MSSLFIFMLCLLPVGALANVTYVPQTRLLSEGAYQMNVLVDTFQTFRPVDDKGRKDDYENQNFRRYQSEFGILYGIGKDFQLGGGARLRQQRGRYFRLGSDTEYTNANAYGLESVFATFQLGFDPVGDTRYMLEGSFRYRPYQNVEVNQNFTDFNRMALGDEGNEYSIGMAVTWPFLSNNFFTLRGGWRRPGDYLSTELYWQAELGWGWKYVALVAGVDGVNSLNNGDPNRPNFYFPTTNLYHGLNREWIAPYAGGNLSLGEFWRLEVRATQVVRAKSYDLGTQVGFNLVRRVDKQDATKRVDSRFKTYDIEATVTKVSPKREYVVIDKGLNNDIEKGLRFDFFEFDYLGGNILVAWGVVIQSKVESSIVKITHHYNLKKEIKEGLVGRASLKQ
jgi:hypothetical protein